MVVLLAASSALFFGALAVTIRLALARGIDAEAASLVTTVIAGVVCALLAVVTGDFSGVAASVPVVLGMLSYSREFEREADEFAIAFLRSQHVSARPLYDFFVKVRRWQSRLEDGQVPDFLATHPSTDERLDRLRREIR